MNGVERAEHRRPRRAENQTDHSVHTQKHIAAIGNMHDPPRPAILLEPLNHIRGRAPFQFLCRFFAVRRA